MEANTPQEYECPRCGHMTITDLEQTLDDGYCYDCLEPLTDEHLDELEARYGK